MSWIHQLIGNVGGRKFAYSVLTLVLVLTASTTMLWADKLEPPHWVQALDVIKWIALTFLGANAVEGAVGRIRKADGGKDAR